MGNDVTACKAAVGICLTRRIVPLGHTGQNQLSIIKYLQYNPCK